MSMHAHDQVVFRLLKNMMERREREGKKDVDYKSVFIRLMNINIVGFLFWQLLKIMQFEINNCIVTKAT
jgi:hypothetical protein